MGRLLIVGLGSGLLFAVMDILVNANPLGRSVFSVYKPLARDRVNAPMGLLIDLAYGLALAAIYLLLWESLPGSIGIVKGLSYAVLLWFLRVAMCVVTQMMTLKIPPRASIYALVTGLVEMGVLGVLYGLLLESSPW
jgi:hypothetical protein